MISSLFIFAGERKSRFRGTPGVDFPDNLLYGMNRLASHGVCATALEPADVFTNERLRRLIPYRFKHLALFFKTFNYDVVFGPTLLYMMLLKKIIRTRTKFVLLTFEIARTLEMSKGSTLRSRFVVWLLKELDGVVCLSRFQKKDLEDTFPFLRGKCFFLPLGEDVQYYIPNYEKRSTYLLSVGRDNGRDYKTVIETARRMPEREFHLVCSPRNLEGIHTIPKNVKVFLDLSITELHKKYQEAEILLLITHDDSFQKGTDCSGQTVLLDAMASGLPVIVSRKKYLVDYVIDKKEAILVDFYAAEGIKDAIESLQNPALRKEIALCARARVEKEFSSERMAENLAKVFSQILENKQ